MKQAWHTTEHGREWMRRWKRAYYAKHANRLRKREMDKYYRRDPRKRKDLNLRRHHGVTVEWYEAQLKKQGGLCFICKTRRGQRELHVDHNHRTGGHRALLCHFCNVALGQMEENTQWLRAAADYLELPWAEMI